MSERNGPLRCMAWLVSNFVIGERDAGVDTPHYSINIET